MIPAAFSNFRMAFMRKSSCLPIQHFIRNLFIFNAKSTGVRNSVRIRAPYTKHEAHFSIPLAEKFACGVTGKIGSVQYEEINDIQKHPNKLLIDVREEREINSGLIPGSINIPLSRLENELSNKVSAEDFYEKYGVEKPLERTYIITSCYSGDRSQLAAERVIRLGYKKVRHYAGSWKEYAEKNNITPPKY